MTSRPSPLTVLMLHGLVRDMPPHAVFPGSRTCLLRVRDFEACLEWCARTHKILTLDDLPRYLRGEAPDPGVLITFDDGLSSVIDLAVPILKRYDATAVLFVTTGLIDSRVAPAIFSLERALWEAPPRTLAVRVPGHGDFTSSIGSRSRLRAALADLWAWCFSHRVAPLSLESEWVSFDDNRWIPGSKLEDPQGWFPARWEDLLDAARAGVLELGTHGVTHTPWSWLSAEERRREIAEPQERLQQLTGRTVSACSYPHGMYDDDARAEVRQHYAWAFTTQGHHVGDDPTDLLPRFHVPSERPVRMNLVVRWPLAGRVLRKGAAMLGQH